MVLIVSSDAFLYYSTQVLSSMASVIMLSINQSIQYKFASFSTAIVYAVTFGVEPGIYSYLGGKCLFGDWISVSCHDLYSRRSLHRSIVSSLIVVYYYGSRLVPNISYRQRRESFPKAAMHIDAICAFRVSLLGSI